MEDFLRILLVLSEDGGFFLFVLSEGDPPYSGGTQRPIFRAQRPSVEAVGTSVPPRTWYEAKNPGTATLL
jgi:hypothetical protein